MLRCHICRSVETSVSNAFDNRSTSSDIRLVAVLSSDVRIRNSRMSTPEQLARQARLLARVRAARETRDKADAAAARADQQLREAIRTAYNAGAEVRDISKAAGLSRQRIHQIVRGA